MIAGMPSEECTALRWQLAVGGDEGGHADKLASVRDVQEAFFGERRRVTGATDIVGGN
jgi:hypothetical protein